MPVDERAVLDRERVEAIVARLVRPLIAVDGGEIDVRECTEQTIVLRLQGTCSGCPGRPFTTARLIEPALRQELGDSITITIEPG